MPTAEFAFTLLALLFAPGPTNTLLALTGAERGPRALARLIPVVAAAYAASVLPLALLGDVLLPAGTGLRHAVTLAAALWVAWMALCLWRLPKAGAPAESVSAGRLFTTTLLNPKALVIGLVLLPGQASLIPAFWLFILLLAAASACWVLVGVKAARVGLLRRISAGWLGLLAIWLGLATI